ncbi:MAG: SCO1664 family protein [Chloroflexi bacterium]|nr:SCO1664 family protein [Chloroflexota bacterium]
MTRYNGAMGRRRHHRHSISPAIRRDVNGAADDGAAQAPAVTLEEAEAFISAGEIVACQPLPWGSNYTYAVAIQAEDQQILGIYKPRRGEVPLWDFPDGTLYRRERAAYLFSRYLGWDFIPPTVIRDGPYGIGSVQLYVEPRPSVSLTELHERHASEFQTIAVFDCLANNADRKAGHFLQDQAGRIWGIDHGLTFNVAPKLRTVVWQYSGMPIPESLLSDVAELWRDARRLRAMCDALGPLLHADEIEALSRRFDRLLTTRRFPPPESRRSVPWPYF